MCGIFGVISNNKVSNQKLKTLVNHCGKLGIYDKGGEKLLFNQSNKNSFYEFVYNNSKK